MSVEPDDPHAATSWSTDPWVPMTRPIDLKHVGKLIEELGEAQSALARCMIQGIESTEPVTKKINREWLEEELADVMANVELVVVHFKLDVNRMFERTQLKIERLRGWHSMLIEEGDLVK